MKRAIAREEQERVKAMEHKKRMTDRFASTPVIAASIIATCGSQGNRTYVPLFVAQSQLHVCRSWSDPLEVNFQP